MSWARAQSAASAITWALYACLASSIFFHVAGVAYAATTDSGEIDDIAGQPLPSKQTCRSTLFMEQSVPLGILNNLQFTLDDSFYVSMYV